MKLIVKSTSEVLANITTNHRMTIDEACDLMDIKIMKTEEDYMNEDGYYIEDLDLVND